MKFIRMNYETLARGEKVFNDYSEGAICGPGDVASFETGKRRRGGVAALPGAAIACLDSGILRRGAAVCAIARATRCRQATVEAFLAEFLGEPDQAGMFDEASGLMLEQQLLSSSVVLAA